MSGRPKNSYKHLHPITKKPINALNYYQIIRQLKNQKKANEELKNFDLGEHQEGQLDLLLKIRTFINSLIEEELKFQRLKEIGSKGSLGGL